MKAMKGLSMKTMLGSVRRRPSPHDGASDTGSGGSQLDTPEANAARNVRLFCESGGPNNSGEEVLYLPAIVEAAESSPAAARECARSIRKFLSKDNGARPHVQYNGIMLIRILADNPGQTFTRNLDKKFVETVKELLRMGADLSVRQILIETLDSFQREKSDGNLALLMQMWEKEQGKMAKVYGPSGSQAAPKVPSTPPFEQHNQNYFSRNHSTNRPLPPPHELSSRIEEARTSAKLLTQLCQSTPPTEFLENDLIREFADRCLSASRSIQGYIVAHDPAPDNDTMLTLIETNEQLALAMSKHQRGVLMARKSLGMSSENGPRTSNGPEATTGFAPPPGPPPSQSKALARPTQQPEPVTASLTTQEPQIQPTTRKIPSYQVPSEPPEDPFRDPAVTTTHNPPFPTNSRQTVDQFQDRLGMEPYHPGFQPTQSYMGRQDSAVGKIAMHAGIPTTEEEEQVEKEVVPQGVDREEDSYDSSPVGRKAPIYRY